MDSSLYKKVIGSSSIAGEHYSTVQKKLYIKFKNNREYVYSNVSPEEYKALFKEDSSFGKELQKTIVNKKEFEEIW